MSRPPSIKPSTRPKPRPGFLAARWSGEVPLSTVFWRDMLLVGSAINVAALIAALTALQGGASTAAVMAVYLAPVPWNLFLFAAVWRAAPREPEPWRSAARFAAFGWLALAVLF